MAKKNALTQSEIVSRIESEEAVAYGLNDAELSEERADAIDRYLGKPYGNEIAGRSQVVSTDVADTIESILPQLLKVFISGDEVVKFNPRGPEDQELAEQETEVINHIVLEKNNGFATFYTWFKDLLLSKNGYVKCYWCEEEETEKEFYQGLTDEEFALLAEELKEAKILEHTEYPDEIDAQQRQEAMAQLQQAAMQNPQAAQQLKQLMSMPTKMLHDVRFETTKTEGKVEIEPVAPENMMVSIDTRCVSVQEARMVQHREMTTIAELKEQGYDVPDSADSFENDWLQEESNARDLYNENDWMNRQGEGLERQILVKDTYIRIDGELKRYIVVGKEIIHEEDVEVIPFACITPIIMPHRHIGRSVADLVSDIQLIKTTLMRGQLDGMYLSLNPRHVVSERVNLDDMLVSRPGGLVRVQGDVGSALMPLPTPDVSAVAYPMMEYMDSVKENRTGVTKYNQGLDANSLNKTATGVNLIMNAAQERIGLIARIFAETGVKELFWQVHRLMRVHSQREMVINLRNKWVTVDPRQWKTRKDLSISVGLGTGNKDQMLAHLMTILQAQKEGLQIGLATPKNIYNALAKMTQNAGFKNPQEFWTDPGDVQKPQQPPQPSPDAVLLSQTEEKKAQLNAQATMQKAEIDAKTAIQKAEIDAEVKLILGREQMALDASKAASSTELEHEKMAHDMRKVSLPHEIEKVKQDEEIQREEAAQEVLTVTLQSVGEALNNMAQAIAMMQRPKAIVRDENGRAVGIQ